MRLWDNPAPGEREAGDRSWDILRDAYEERIRVPRKRDWRPIAIAATVAGKSCSTMRVKVVTTSSRVSVSWPAQLAK